MLIKNTPDLIKNKNIKTYFCDDKKIKKYLDDKNILPIYNSNKNVWVYLLCNELQDALQELKGGEIYQ